MTEPVTLIIIGEDHNRLTPAVAFASLSSHDGSVICSCTGCPPTLRMLVGPVLLGQVEVMPHDGAAFKPAEIHVINFKAREKANAWLKAEKANFVDKTVYLLPQAPYPGP